MKYKLMAVAVCSALLLLGCSTSPKMIRDTTVPQTIFIKNNELQLNGAGIREKYLVEVYVGSLYLSGKSSDASQILSSQSDKCITLKTLVYLSKETMQAAILNGIVKNVSDDEFESLQGDVDTFNSFFIDTDKNTMFQINFLASGDTELLINQKKRGSVEGFAFQKALLSIWLGDKPPTETIKKAMLNL